MAYANSGLVGADSDRRTSEMEYALGTTFCGDDAYDYVYVQANGAIAAAQADVAVSAAFQASDGAGTLVNTTAFADNEYGFVRSATRTFDE